MVRSRDCRRTGECSVAKTFIAHYAPGENWLEGRPMKDQPLKAHVDYLLGLHDMGTLLMGGPWADGSGGMVVFAAESIEDVQEMLASDPAILSGILTASAKEWARIV